MKKALLLLLLPFLYIGVNIKEIQSCASYFTFRSYLERSFWQPLRRYLGNDYTKLHSENSGLFAGRSGAGKNPALQKVAAEYSAIATPLSPSLPPVSLDPQRTAVDEAVKAPGLTQNEKEELALVDCKIDMREGEGGKVPILARAKGKLQLFIESAQSPALASEARGWLARVHYLLGEYSQAAKIYLDELPRRDSVLSAKTLYTSLRTIYPYNGSSARLANHLEDFFDTPRHALFAVNIATNPISASSEERKMMGRIGRQALDALEKHRSLFRFGDESDALVLGLMRSALYMGDPSIALRYSAMVSKKSSIAEGIEYNWMLGIIHFLKHDYAAAEKPLLKMYRSAPAASDGRSAAAQALQGVYHKLNRPADELYAAFLNPTKSQEEAFAEETTFVVPWPYWGYTLDLSYLLDVQLTEQELEEYLLHYPMPVRDQRPTYCDRKRSSTELVKYALAVRRARREHYADSARLYESIEAVPRARRMHELDALYTNSIDMLLPKETRLKALFDYGVFLLEHPNQIFFNDSLWQGNQTWSFLTSQKAAGLTKADKDAFTAKERTIRDEQEERWRAAKILMDVVSQAGPGDLGRRAARKALAALHTINIRRFGRDQEIEAKIRDIQKWLHQNP